MRRERARIRGLLTAVGILVSAGWLSGQVPDRSAADALAARAAVRMAALQKESESLAHQEQTLLVELRGLEVDREIKTEQLAAIEHDETDIEAQLAASQAQTASLAGDAARQQPDVDARLVQLYKLGHAGYWRMLLDVGSLQDLGRAYRTAAALGRIDHDRVEEHRRTLASLASERARLQQRSKELAALRVKAQTARAAVDRAVAAHASLVQTIDGERDLNAQLTGELQDAAQKLQTTIAQLAAGRPAGPASLPIAPFRGALPWPAEGVPMSNGRKSAAVRSLELSLPEGRPVHPVHDGVVAYADPFTGYGNLVIVDHGDQAFSLYGNLSTIGVHKGDRVDAASTLGLSGRNPSGNPSLYFELRIDGRPVDPLQWLKKP
jgi:septal ring factor EnvC (AmiA/AmiB activator)